MWEGFGGVIRCGGKRMGRHPTKVKETLEVVVFIPHTPGRGGRDGGGFMVWRKVALAPCTGKGGKREA